MAMRVKNGVEPITSPAGIDRGGSRPKPPKAVAQRASLEASRCMPDHQKAKRRLTRNTVAFAMLRHFRSRFSQQIEVASTEEILDGWRAR
jgi:hypothetical protein